ncbi:hypothetical protein H4R33_001516 [Dimargaris cristalligena]|nr:hypothetical protein H4R33_001516 [Dimargaris cristalligena]
MGTDLSIAAWAIREGLLNALGISLVNLVSIYNLYHSVLTLYRNRQIIHVFTFLMNLGVLILSIGMNLREVAQYTCRIYARMFYAAYFCCSLFSGLVLLTKSYYASNFKRKILYPLSAGQFVALVVLLVSFNRIKVVLNDQSQQCDVVLDRDTFVPAMTLEFALNLAYSVLFLLYIFQANRRFDSSLYAVLFRDGMVYWLVTSIFPIILALAAFIPTLAEAFTGLLVGYPWMNFCHINWYDFIYALVAL